MLSPVRVSFDPNAERVAPFFSIALATVPSTLTSLRLQTDLVFILIPILPSVMEAIQPALRVFLRAFTHFTLEDGRSLRRGLSGYTCWVRVRCSTAMNRCKS